MSKQIKHFRTHRKGSKKGQQFTAGSKKEMLPIPVRRSVVPVDTIRNEFVLYFAEVYYSRNNALRINHFRIPSKYKYFINRQDEIKKLLFLDVELKDFYVKDMTIIERIALTFKGDSRIPNRFKPVVKEVNLDVYKKKFLKNLKLRRKYCKRKIEQLKKLRSKEKDAVVDRDLYYRITHFEFVIDQLNKEIDCVNLARLYKVSFKIPLISFLKQKKLYPRTSNFFVDLIMKKGKDFDKYIDDWAKRLLSQRVVLEDRKKLPHRKKLTYGGRK